MKITYGYMGHGVYAGFVEGETAHKRIQIAPSESVATVAGLVVRRFMATVWLEHQVKTSKPLSFEAAKLWAERLLAAHPLPQHQPQPGDGIQYTLYDDKHNPLLRGSYVELIPHVDLGNGSCMRRSSHKFLYTSRKGGINHG